MTAGEGGAPAVTIFSPPSNRMPCAAQYCVSVLTTTGAPHKCVTPSARISSTIFCGSTCRRHTCRAPAAVTAHGKHQPLQWNIGSVHRYTELLVSPCSTTSPSAFRYAPRCVYITPLDRKSTRLNSSHLV